MRFRYGAIAIALLLVFVAAGCGKKKSAVTTAAAPPATTTSASNGGGNTTPTTTSDNTTTSGGSSTNSGKPKFTLSKNCLQLKSAGQQISAAVQAAVASGSTSAVAKEVDLFKALAAAAPSEIRADVETVANAYATAATALAKVHFTPGQTPTPKQIAELQAVGKSFNVAKVEAAGKRLETWGKSHCGG